MPEPRRPTVALLAWPDTSPAVLYGMYDVLLSVGAIFSDLTGGQPEDALLDVRIVAATAEPFRCFGNVPIEPGAALADIEQVDVAVACDIYASVDAPPTGRFRHEAEWLRRMHARGAIIASVCSGSLVLAEAGMLDGLECAGHWGYRDLFRAHYPQVRFQAGSVLALAGDGSRIVTAGGHSSWHDLVLHLIGRLCGARHAIRTAKVFLLSGHPDGQLPFAAMSRRIQRSDAVISRCQEWIADHYAGANPVSAMAERSGLKARTFARRFHAATGYLPIDYVHTLRIEEAKQLLETGSDGIDEVGATVGYEDPTFFRRLFKRKAGLTPAAYRRRFRAIGEAGR
ncbi:MAG: GlxA family transcriptional regulator [Alphaproteobacteria bacterium]